MIGLIVGLVTLSVSVLARSDGVELRQAEAVLSGQLTLARATAIRMGKTVRLAVNLDSANMDERLAVIGLLVRDAATNDWVLLNDPVRLSGKIRVVPEASVPAAADVSWPANVVSRWTSTEAFNTPGLPAGRYGYLEFATTGGIFGNPKLAFSTVARQANSVEFNSADQVRCFMVRGSGVATLFRESASIP